MEIKNGRVVYDTSRDRRQLARLKGDKGALKNSGWSAVGLTLTEMEFKMKLQVNSVSNDKVRYCASIHSIKASLGYDELVVYVARKYRRGSCPYNSIVAHERKHVAIFRDALVRYAPLVERRLAEAARRLRPIRTKSPKRATARLQRKLEREIRPLFNKLNKALDTANAELDTAENYEREQAACPRW